jgi:hypothetical protein
VTATWEVLMMNGGPGFWMHEETGVLRPAIEAYLQFQPLSETHIALIRRYLHQWIMAPCWGPGDVDILSLRARVDKLDSRDAIDRWLDDALDCGIDPL